MKYLLSIDPGLSSGVFLGSYSDTQPLERIAVWQFGGIGDDLRGVDALVVWVRRFFIGHTSQGLIAFWWEPGMPSSVIRPDDLTIIAEKFTPLSGQGHSLTLDAVEPLRCEGALIALGLMPAEFPHEQWQRPAVMYFSGGSDLAAKKKASRAWLKSHDLLPTGKTVGQKDANDAVSATLHAFAYMRKMRHQPTMDHYWGQEMKEEK